MRGRGDIQFFHPGVPAPMRTLRFFREPDRPTRLAVEPPIGTVIRFERQFRANGRNYTYVAVRVDREQAPWFVSGNSNYSGVEWGEVRDLIGNTNKCEIALEWFEVPAMIDENAAASRIDPAEYVKRCWTTPEDVVE